MEFLCTAVQVYLIICVVRVIFSWIPVGDNGYLSAIQSVSYNLTEPLFSTVRRALPRPGDLPLDLSPVVVILLLTFVRGIICR